MMDYFSQSEFERCSPACNKSDMSPEFLERLNVARRVSCTPYILNSAYRSREYELTRGRSGTSSHCKGLAVDIRCVDSRERGWILSGLIRAGFHRIGISKRFIHVDDDLAKPFGIWLYD